MLGGGGGGVRKDREARLDTKQDVGSQQSLWPPLENHPMGTQCKSIRVSHRPESSCRTSAQKPWWEGLYSTEEITVPNMLLHP